MKAINSIGEVKSKSKDIQFLIEAYNQIGKSNSAMTIKQCSNVILSKQCQQHAEHQSVQIQYCKNRFCPICTVHRSYMLGAQLKSVIEDITQRSKGHWLFLTLTVKNVFAEELSDTVGHMMKSWQRLSQRKQVRSVLQGWFRGLEVTFNEKDQTFHPHFHVLIYVKQSYFTGKYYLKQKVWMKLWRESLQVDYDPVVDVRRVKSRTKDDNDLVGAVVEVTKYPMKFESVEAVIHNSYFELFEQAMFKRRTIAFGGVLRSTLKDLKIDLDEDRHVHDSECKTCGGETTQNYILWSDSQQMYQSYS